MTMDLQRRLRIPWPVALPIAVIGTFASSQALSALYSPQPADTRAIPLPAEAWYNRSSTWSDAGIRVVEVILAVCLIRRTRARLIDAGWMGVAVAMVGRLPLLAFQNAHFLLPLSTLNKTLPLDLLPPFVGLSLFSFLTEPAPRFKAHHHALLAIPPRCVDGEAYAVGIALSTLVGALWSFAIDRSGLLELVASQGLPREIPAKLAAVGDSLKPSFIMSHPTLMVPILRAPAPSPMPLLLIYTLLSCSIPSLLLPFTIPFWISPLVTWVVSFLTISKAGVAPLVTPVAAFWTATQLSVEVLLVQGVLNFVTQDARRKQALEASKKVS